MGKHTHGTAPLYTQVERSLLCCRAKAGVSEAGRERECGQSTATERVTDAPTSSSPNTPGHAAATPSSLAVFLSGLCTRCSCFSRNSSVTCPAAERGRHTSGSSTDVDLYVHWHWAAFAFQLSARRELTEMTLLRSYTTTLPRHVLAFIRSVHGRHVYTHTPPHTTTHSIHATANHNRFATSLASHCHPSYLSLSRLAPR